VEIGEAARTQLFAIHRHRPMWFCARFRRKRKIGRLPTEPADVGALELEDATRPLRIALGPRALHAPKSHEQIEK
jgi:hypothetical protein